MNTMYQFTDRENETLETAVDLLESFAKYCNKIGGVHNGETDIANCAGYAVNALKTLLDAQGEVMTLGKLTDVNPCEDCHGCDDEDDDWDIDDDENEEVDPCDLCNLSMGDETWCLNHCRYARNRY